MRDRPTTTYEIKLMHYLSLYDERILNYQFKERRAVCGSDIMYYSFGRVQQ